MTYLNLCLRTQCLKLTQHVEMVISACKKTSPIWFSMLFYPWSLKEKRWKSVLPLGMG